MVLVLASIEFLKIWWCLTKKKKKAIEREEEGSDGQNVKKKRAAWICVKYVNIVGKASCE